MSGDVQPRKRKDKRRKKDEEDLHHAGSAGPEEIIHIQKDLGLGGNICAKIVFFCLLGALGVMVGLIITEYRGSSEVDSQPALDSPWSLWLDGWIDDAPSHHEAEVDTGEIEDDHAKGALQQDDSNETEVEGEIVPEIVRRQTLIPPSEEIPASAPPAEEYEYSEGEDEEEEEEEDEEELVQKTYEDLRAQYQQQTPEGSDVEPTDEDFATKAPDTYDYSPTPPDSEPEEGPTESDVEEEDEEEDRDPMAEWKNRGPALLAEEVEDVQTGSESEDEPPPPPVASSRRGGPLGIGELEQDYENADITNEADWEIKDDLDFADADLNDGDLTN